MAGGIVSNAAYKPAMLAFMLPTILPAIAIWLAARPHSQCDGVMLAAFTAVLLVTGRNINLSIVENFRLRIAQGILLAKLGVSEAVMAQAQEMAHIGSWDIDLVARATSAHWRRTAFSVSIRQAQTLVRRDACSDSSR